MFDTLNNPATVTAAILAGAAVIALLCKCIATLWRIGHIRQGDKQDKFFHYTPYEKHQKAQFANRLHRQ